jgi:Zn ribbon nucleic-acid-binding protein
MTGDICPQCKANLRGDEIPRQFRECYGGLTHFTGLIAVEVQGEDRVSSWHCPECGFSAVNRQEFQGAVRP